MKNKDLLYSTENYILYIIVPIMEINLKKHACAYIYELLCCTAET